MSFLSDSGHLDLVTRVAVQIQQGGKLCTVILDLTKPARLPKTPALPLLFALPSKYRTAPS